MTFLVGTGVEVDKLLVYSSPLSSFELPDVHYSVQNLTISYHFILMHSGSLQSNLNSKWSRVKFKNYLMY